MSTQTSAQIRQAFLDYFARRGHNIVKSSALIPANDPTLMFTNAGMVQFKDVFVGRENRGFTRATSAQKCMRVSGKHNDLEEVGRTARHHTFFEMLGNFSFGDYFKEEAIKLAWTFVTKEAGLDPQRLWVTVFSGEQNIPGDDEARSLWQKISGLPPERILGKGSADNFWAMGESGPCGPCTEIHYDLGEGSTPTEHDFATGRVVEIWNIVFMQFDREAGGKLTPLPKPSVDTGMGLERLCAVMQGKKSNYATDLFMPSIEKIAALAGKKYQASDSADDISMRVIADHARATAFLTSDGLQPANDGRGYVMRRIMRRAIRHGQKLGFNDLFFDKICATVVDNLGQIYPELLEAQTLISKVAQNEERCFRRTLDTGLRLLEADIATAKNCGAKALGGAAVFKLYDTYGFPRDLTEVIAAEHGLSVDTDGFERAMRSQQSRSRGSDIGDKAIAAVYKDLALKLSPTTFVGYLHEDEMQDSSCSTWRLRTTNGVTWRETQTKVVALIVNGESVTSAVSGDLEVVLEPTPFYGESGGQIGDQGQISNEQGLWIRVDDNQKPSPNLTVAQGQITAGKVQVGDLVWAGYNPNQRRAIRSHHSAAHLLHGALRAVLGEHVKQQGSLVDDLHLRFDYSHFAQPSETELLAVEDEVNRRIQKKYPVETEVLPFDEAKKRGAIALFGEKYGDVVRMVKMGGSTELCGGTHAKNTADLGILLIVKEEAVASGIRRIEAEVAGAALTRINQWRRLLKEAAQLLADDGYVCLEQNQPILAAVTKHKNHGKALVAELTALGKEAAQLNAKRPEPNFPAWQEVACPGPNSTALELAGQFDLENARRLRETWQSLIQIVTRSGPEPKEPAGHPSAPETSGLLAYVAELIKTNRENERRLAQVQHSLKASTAAKLSDNIETVAGIKLLTARVDGSEGKALRELADELRTKLNSGVICLGSQTGDKAALLIAVTKDLTTKFSAGNLIAKLAPIIGGRGGGKPELAQAGGNDGTNLDKVFVELRSIIANG